MLGNQDLDRHFAMTTKNPKTDDLLNAIHLNWKYICHFSFFRWSSLVPTSPECSGGAVSITTTTTSIFSAVPSDFRKPPPLPPRQMSCPPLPKLPALPG